MKSQPAASVSVLFSLTGTVPPLGTFSAGICCLPIPPWPSCLCFLAPLVVCGVCGRLEMVVVEVEGSCWLSEVSCDARDARASRVFIFFLSLPLPCLRHRFFYFSLNSQRILAILPPFSSIF